MASWLGIVACEPAGTAQPSEHGMLWSPSLPIPNATLSCSYSPSGNISIAVGQTQTFVPSDVDDCNGAFGVLTPTDGRVGLGVGSPCTAFQAQESGGANLFKVRRCSSGPASLKIYTNSSKTTLLQTIGIDLL
jgi:hypothetical protein